MKEYSKQFVDRLAYASFALALIVGGLSPTIAGSRVLGRPYAIGIAAAFFILGAALILRTRATKRFLSIGIIISGVVFIASTVCTMVLPFSSTLVYIAGTSAVAACVFLVASTHLSSQDKGFGKNKFYTTAKIIFWLAALYVLIFVGTVRREFFPEYLWIVLAVGALATLARRAIMRTTTPRND